MAKARTAALVIAAGVSCVLTCLFTAPLAAGFDFDEVSVGVSSLDGGPERSAGSHPDLTFFTSFPVDGQMVHDNLLAQPPGFVGYPATAPTCDPLEFNPPYVGQIACPVSSQVGIARGRTIVPWSEPIYNLSHGKSVASRFAFRHAGVYVYVDTKVRPDDYGVTSGSRGTTQTEVVHEAEIQIWGVPQDPAHDPFRISPQFPEGGAPPAAPALPLLRAPTSCTEKPVTFRVEADSWEAPGVFDVVPLSEDGEGVPFSFEGCEELPFNPDLTIGGVSSAADSPTGLTVDVGLPQNEDPYGRSTSDVRRIVTTFPAGMTISNSAAAGLESCSQGQIGIGSNDPPACPDSSKLGTATIDTPVVGEPLEGSIYLATQGENPFGSLLAIYLAVEGPGFYLKLPGKIDADPDTGRLTVTFSEMPQLPFEHLRLELKSGPPALLTTPRGCGTFAVTGEFVPWSGTGTVPGESKIRVDEGCSEGFAPKLRAGTARAKAGSSSPFTLQVTRRDGEANLTGIDVTLPEGLLAKVAGVPLCGDVQAATGDCPAASRIGRVTVGAGAGPTPVYVPEAGKALSAVNLAGPYKGAPYSIVLKVPAQAGPFDLGSITVRSRIYVDPVTARASVKSDPLPQILRGIPIAYRDVRIEIDRPGFVQTPTGCGPKKIESTIYGSGGAEANPAANYRARDCRRLGFEPKLSLRFSGPTHRSTHPAVKAVLKMPTRRSNIRKATILLPATEFIDSDQTPRPCTPARFSAGTCPKESLLGTATVDTPLLDEPLRGPVYFRSNDGAREYPDLVADLDGPVQITPVAYIDSVRTGRETGRVRIRFAHLPDAPISKFALSMTGGHGSLIVNNTELCRVRPRAAVRLSSQNGKHSSSTPRVRLSCGR